MSGTIQSIAAKPRRRWLQYSLRTLLVLMLVVACGFGWLAREVERVRVKHNAAVAIKELGGRVRYSDVFSPSLAAGLFGTLSSEDFGQDSACDVDWVSFQGAQFSDTGLVYLQKLTQLRVLHLDNTPVSDAGLAHLQGLTQLEILSLDNTQISDAGLTHLQGLTQLRYLSVNKSQVTDAGVAELQKALQNCKITR